VSLSVWKFPLRVDDVVPVEMPEDAKLLTVQLQRGEPCLWALVCPEAPKRTRFLRIVGTGHPVEDDLLYVGTFQLQNGALVFHLFEGQAARE